jgi:hypothetical protein
MLIYTLWHEGDDGSIPWLVDAVDEYTIDSMGEYPPEYLKKRDYIHVRELVIDVSEKAVRALFEPPVVKAQVVEPHEEGV